jgi:hypothetical protein
MPVTVEGIEELKLLIQQTGEKAVKGALDQMKIAGVEIQELAIKYAPVDKGNLEAAIKTDVEGGGRNEDTGQFQRKEVSVYIDMDMPVDDPGRKHQATVGDYAYEIHEHLTPVGPKQLGPLSREKQAGQSEIVGGGFLERAGNDLEEKILADVTRAVVEIIGSEE